MRAANSSKFATHARVVRALVHREMTSRYAKTSGGYFWAIAEPIAIIALLTMVFSLMVRSPPLGDSFMLFFATGYLPFFVFRRLSAFGSLAISANRALLNFPLVSPYDTVIARSYLEIVTSAAVILIVSVGIFSWLGETPALRPFQLMAGFAAAVGIGVSAALCNSVLYIIYPTWERVFAILTRPLLIISGVFFIPSSVPTDIREWLMWNPIAHAISLFRSGVFPSYDPPYIDYAYLFGWILVTGAAGMLLIHLNRYAITDR